MLCFNNEKRCALERELAKLLVVTNASVHDGGTWFRSRTLEELLNLILELRDEGVRIVVGNTEMRRHPNLVHASTPIRGVKTTSVVISGHRCALSKSQRIPTLVIVAFSNLDNNNHANSIVPFVRAGGHQDQARHLSEHDTPLQ